jgi:ABC-type nickel/cobalt efflux system permease component RcnA
MQMTLALAGVAAGIGALHTLAPDHWVPFAALARAERWTPRRTAAITAACGLGHVTVSVLLGAVSLLFGLELIQAFGERLENIAGLLLVGFGVVYCGWGLHRAMRARIHQHMHEVLPPHHHAAPGDVDVSDGHDSRHSSHHHHGHFHHQLPGSTRRLTPWTLFLLFSADPCVAVIPLMFASAPLGWGSTLLVVLAYESATIATMVGLVLPTQLVATSIRADWADRFGDAIAGAIIAGVGIAVAVIGI